MNFNGLNLGLVNVNPFFSLQVTKDQYGGKVIHPNINLHVTPSEHLLTKLIDKKKTVKKTILYHKLGNLGPHSPPLHTYGHGHTNYAPVYSGHSHYSEVPPPYLDYDPTLILRPQQHFHSSPYQDHHYPSPPYPSKPFHSVPPSFSPANEYSPYFYAPTHHAQYRSSNITDKSFIVQSGPSGEFFNENDSNNHPTNINSSPHSTVVFPNSRNKRNVNNPNELLESVSYLRIFVINLLLKLSSKK